ncbi:hypothetical protein AB0H57_00395 [Micromonospora sp. NPDC050686]|uniref:hypothetical protein n=1 Tax=Micromonospora sp. NPDC050686 TaxID=3154631 RepID=UPI0033C66B5B
MIENWRAERVGVALRGENPTVLRRLSAGFAVIGGHDDLRADLIVEIAALAG